MSLSSPPPPPQTNTTTSSQPDDSSFSTTDNGRKWALGLSGGGLRSCSASAILCLAAMHTPLFGKENAASSSSDTKLSLWDKFSRVIAVSGGTWFLSAYQCGALRALSEEYTIEELIEVLLVSVVHSGNPDEREDKISSYLHERAGVRKQRENDDDEILQGEVIVDNKTGEPLVDNKTGQPIRQNQQPQSASASSSPSTQQQQNKKEEFDFRAKFNLFTTNARNAVRSQFVNRVLKPTASALNAKFGSGVIFAITSETPLADYQEYLKQCLLIEDDCSFGSIPSRRAVMNNNNNNNQNQNSSRQERDKTKELWMACIGTETFDPSNNKNNSKNSKNKNSVNDDGQNFVQPEWSATKLKATSSTSWIAFGLTSPSTVFQISVHEEETVSALPYEKKQNTGGDDDNNSSGQTKNQNHVRQKYNFKIQTEELVPMEPLPLKRMCAFCGSAFSASLSNITDHAVSNGLGAFLSWGSEKLFGKERGENFHSSPVLGAKTVDVVPFFKQAPRRNSNPHNNNIIYGGEHHPEMSTGKEVSIALRDAGLEVNIPFLFMETDLFPVSFVLDSGSDAECGRQILWAQRKGHLGEYTPIFSSNEAKKLQKQQQKSAASASLNDDDHNSNNKNQQQKENEEKEKEKEDDHPKKQTWQIYLKDKSHELGPSIIVYILGICEPELMEVKDVELRVKKLKKRYFEMREEFKFIVEWLVERGFS